MTNQDITKAIQPHLNSVKNNGNRMNINKHEPDELDNNCSKIFHVLKELGLELEDEISLLEQCVDYIRMEIADEKGQE